MSSNAVRTGVPTTPTTTTDGTPGTSDDVREFESYTRPCIVTNISSEVLYVLVNEEGASATNYAMQLAAGQAVDVSLGGHIAVQKVSLYFAAAAYTLAQVRGWDK